MPYISSVTGSKGYAGISLKIPEDEPEYKNTIMFFPQAWAPTGWNQIDVADFTLRITSGDTHADSGTNPFTSTYPGTVSSFPTQSAEWNFDAVTHYTTISEMPSHIHYGKTSAFVNTATTHALGPTLGASLGQVNIPSPLSLAPGVTAHNALIYVSPLGSPTSTGEGHAHSFTGGVRVTSSSTIDLRIKYIHTIVAIKGPLV